MTDLIYKGQDGDLSEYVETPSKETTYKIPIENELNQYSADLKHDIACKYGYDYQVHGSVNDYIKEQNLVLDSIIHEDYEEIIVIEHTVKKFHVRREDVDEFDPCDDNTFSNEEEIDNSEYCDGWEIV